ncbi:MAG: NUDIX hydrolase, partial [Draconibacterium sp.]|nr:NUDIX hydrolase [Draconibacterium sp.]
RAALTVDAIVFVRENNSTYILLIQRGGEPFKNRWALPGGFIEIDETLEEACMRELYEETGLQVKQMTQFRAFDAVNRDPRHRTISVVFFTELPDKKAVKGGDDAALAKWFTVSDLPKLAFDHDLILNEFLEMK